MADALITDRARGPHPRAKRSSLSDLRWLERYARYCGFRAVQAPLLQALRKAFGTAAWRIICRSPKSCFLPILRIRDLTLHSLIAYCRRLAERSFVQAPNPLLLAYFVGQRRLYLGSPRFQCNK